MTQTSVQIFQALRTAVKSGVKGEILRVSTKRERNDVLFLARLLGWDLRTEFDKTNNNYRVIAA